MFHNTCRGHDRMKSFIRFVRNIKINEKLLWTDKIIENNLFVMDRQRCIAIPRRKNVSQIIVNYWKSYHPRLHDDLPNLNDWHHGAMFKREESLCALFNTTYACIWRHSTMMFDFESQRYIENHQATAKTTKAIIEDATLTINCCLLCLFIRSNLIIN